ncbi:MAG: RlmE family RNA methyltransferase [Treponema sp.]|nr:RlmE family RNA methyltransferase [Treponema sp.]
MGSYDKPDFWAQKAQKEAYPARSVYKLKEMDEKFGLFRPPGGRRVLDLGAAPGSWSLYALRKNPAPALTAVDLSPLSRDFDKGLFEGGNFGFLQGDMTDPGIREAIRARGPFDLVMSDAAPATSGNRSLDSLRSLALAETALDYGEQFLCKGGALILKIFQGGQSAGLLKRIQRDFESAKAFKPRACRSNSFETYFVGMKFKAAVLPKDA